MSGSRVSPNRATRRHPLFVQAVEEVQEYALNRLAVEGVPLWQLRIAAEVVERIAHGHKQAVSTEHLQERCRKAGIEGGRYYSHRPGYGTVVRVLDRLKALGVLVWERCTFDPDEKKSPARRLQLQGEALAIVARALRATWTQAVVVSGAVRSEDVPPSQSAMGAEAPAAPMSSPESPPARPALDFSGARAIGLLSDRS